MNYRMILHTLGKILIVEAILMLLPLLVSVGYKEGTYYSFLITISLLLVFGFLLSIKRPKETKIYAKEGFVIVGLAWILISLFGALPFVISKEIPNYIDALFETISGFTTTGASILTDVEKMSKGMLFWRSFTHWIGGMGVLVFVLAILPNSETSMHLLRAESPGPQVGKLVSKVKFTARILYGIYIAMTLVQIIFLVCGGMNLFDSTLISFGTAGTGGFGIKNDSIASYSVYSQIVIGIFMLLFGINFNLYYLIIIGQVRQAFKSEELRWYVGIVFVSVITIAVNIFYTVDTITSFSLALKESFFQVSSIITTTGFVTTNYDLWPSISKTILVILMFVGACAGSTGGGIKVSRLIILIKSIRREVKNLLHPKCVQVIKFEEKTLDENVTKSITNYFALMICLFVVFLLIISIDGFSLTTNFTAVAACINNVGPGLDIVGPIGNYSAFSEISKVALSISMLIGRLEIFPILMLFYPVTWKRS